MRLLGIIAWLIAVNITGIAHAYDKAYNADINKVERYLNSIKTLVANFSQVADDGGVSFGTFYLSRPGKLRWEYDPPNPILIIANKNTLTYHDSELDQTSYVALGDNLGGFLIKPRIRFKDKHLDVLDVKKEGKHLHISLTQKDKIEEGVLTLSFFMEPVQLTEMKFFDAVGKEVQISFNNIRYGSHLKKSLFVLPHFPKKD